MLSRRSFLLALGAVIAISTLPFTSTAQARTKLVGKIVGKIVAVRMREDRTFQEIYLFPEPSDAWSDFADWEVELYSDGTYKVLKVPITPLNPDFIKEAFKEIEKNKKNKAEFLKKWPNANNLPSQPIRMKIIHIQNGDY